MDSPLDQLIAMADAQSRRVQDADDKLERVMGWLQWRQDWTGDPGPVHYKGGVPWFVFALRGDRPPRGYPK